MCNFFGSNVFAPFQDPTHLNAIVAAGMLVTGVRKMRQQQAAQAVAEPPPQQEHSVMTPSKAMEMPLESPVWRSPFVEVLKIAMNHKSIGFHLQGDVQQVHDKKIAKHVFRIGGTIAATNFLRIPRVVSKVAPGLGISGRYIYILMRQTLDHSVTIHVDLVTSKKSVVRFTLSSMYDFMRSASTVLRIPLRLSDKWSVVVLDMHRLLELHTFNGYCREKYRYLKSITLCCNMSVRSVLVSNVLSNYESLPQRYHFHDSSQEAEWKRLYDYVMVPAPHDTALSPRTPVVKSPILYDKARPSANRSKKISQLSRETPVERVSQHTTDETASVLSPIPQTTSEAYAEASPTTRETLLRKDRYEIIQKADQIMSKAGIRPPESKSASKGNQLQEYREKAEQEELKQREWPDPLLILHRIIGFSVNFPNNVLWLPSTNSCVYSSVSTIVKIRFLPHPETSMQTQGLVTSSSFLNGHSGAIYALAVSRETFLLASSDDVLPSMIRLWDLRTDECIAVLNGPGNGIICLRFSEDGQHFCVAGHDEQVRTQLFVWNMESIREGGRATLIARQTSDFPVSAVAFSIYDKDQLVSCGKENVRFWRMRHKKNLLTGSPVILNEYARGTVFTDLSFDKLYGAFPSNIRRIRPLYVSSASGNMTVIDYDSKQVSCVYKLHDAKINCFYINEGFCFTGSEDRFLRVWPLDFTDFVLEAQHEDAVVSIDVSEDGMKAVVGTLNGAIGLMDISQQKYHTVMRTHTKPIIAGAVRQSGDPSDELKPYHFVTASLDGTMRVWDVLSAQQVYEFDMQQDSVTCLGYHPQQQQVAVGFVSGCTRVFDILNTSVAEEFQQHQSSLRAVKYSNDGRLLYTTGAHQQLCLYDTDHHYFPLKMVLADFDSSDGEFSLSNDQRHLAFVSQDHSAAVVLHARTLKQKYRIVPPVQQLNDKRMTLWMKRVEFSWDSQEMLMLSQSNRLYFYSLEKQKPLHSTSLSSNPLEQISSLAISPNMKYFVAGNSDGLLKVWRYDSTGSALSRIHQSFVGQHGNLRVVHFTADGEYIVATGDTSSVYIWKFQGETSGILPVWSNVAASVHSSPRKPLRSMDEKDALSDDDDHEEDDEQENEDPLSNDQVDHLGSPLSQRISRKAKHQLKIESPAKRQSPAASPAMQSNIETIDCSVQLENGALRSFSLGYESTFGAVCGAQSLWSYATGYFIMAKGSLLVVEDIEDGRERVFDESLHGTSRIAFLRLSPCTKQFCWAVEDLECMFVYDLVTHQLWHVTCVSALHLDELELVEFTSDLRQLVLVGLSRGNQSLAVIDITSNQLLSNHTRDDHLFGKIHSVFAVQKDAAGLFMTLDSEHRALSLWKTWASAPEILMKIPLSSIACSSLYRGESQGKRGVLVIADSQSRCYFFDVDAHEQLGSVQLDPRVSIDFAELVHQNESYYLLTGSRSRCHVTIHRLPNRKSISGHYVDWTWVNSRGTCDNSMLEIGDSSHTITKLHTDPLGEDFLVQSSDGSVYLVNAALSSVRAWKQSQKSLRQVSFVRENHLMVTLSQENHLSVWCPGINGRAIATFHLSNATTCDVFAVNPFMKSATSSSFGIAAAYSDGTLRILNLGTLRNCWQCNVWLSMHHGILRNKIKNSGAVCVSHLAFAGANLLLVALTNHQVLLFELGEPPRAPTRRNSNISLFKMSPNGTAAVHDSAPISAEYRQVELGSSEHIRVKLIVGMEVQFAYHSNSPSNSKSPSSPKVSNHTLSRAFLVMCRMANAQTKTGEQLYIKVYDTYAVMHHDKIEPIDSWQCSGVTELASSSCSLACVHGCFLKASDHVVFSTTCSIAATSLQPCLEIRDYRRHCTLRRLTFDSLPTALFCVQDHQLVVQFQQQPSDDSSSRRQKCVWVLLDCAIDPHTNQTEHEPPRIVVSKTELPVDQQLSPTMDPCTLLLRRHNICSRDDDNNNQTDQDMFLLAKME